MAIISLLFFHSFRFLICFLLFSAFSGPLAPPYYSLTHLLARVRNQSSAHSKCKRYVLATTRPKYRRRRVDRRPQDAGDHHLPTPPPPLLAGHITMMNIGLLSLQFAGQTLMMIRDQGLSLSHIVRRRCVADSLIELNNHFEQIAIQVFL